MDVKKISKYILSALLAVFLLRFSFRDVDWNEFLAGLKTCRWELILLSMAAGSFAFWLRGVRWRRLLLPFDPGIRRITTFNGINVGNISNLVLPRIGEFVRCGVITRRTSISYDKVLGTVVLERGWELLVMLLMLALALLLGFERFGAFFVERIWTPMTQRFDIWWGVIVAVTVICAAAAVAMVRKYRDSSRLCGKVAAIFKGLLQGFSSCLKMDRKWLFFLYTLLIWVTYWFMASCTVLAAPFLSHLDLVDALFLSLVGGLGFAVPVPGGIGAFHYIIALALSTVYDVPEETGIIYATISHASQAMTQILFGAVSYGYEALKK